MIHIGVTRKHKKLKGVLFTAAACGAVVRNECEVTATAFQSDCNACREKFMLSPVAAFPQRPVREWVPEPMANADEICASARLNRNS